MRNTTIDKELNRSKKEYKNNRNKNIYKTNYKSSKNGVKTFLVTMFVLLTLCCWVGLFLLYSPYAGFRDWLITTAMSTMTHQYLATWFYDEETINDCLARNSIEDTGEVTDTNLINIVDYAEEDNIEYENEYEEAVLKKSSKNNDYKIIEIEGDKYSGYLAVVYEPSRVKVAASKYLGKDGQYLTTISEQHNSFLAINAGGFVDEAGDGTGGIPVGITISDNVYLWTDSYSGQGGLIGLNNDDKLILGKYSVRQTKSLGIRDGVTFGPFLVVNGEAVTITGNGGWGRSPRTAIAQRQDGIMLFLVLDGNRTLGQGATLKDVQEILVKYGAYNAANLDGGTSTSMTVHTSLVNDPTSQSGSHRTRPVATAFILEADESDDGDYSVVSNKVDN